MRIKGILAGLSLALLGSAAHATVIYSLEGAGVHTTQVAGTTTVNFNDGNCGAYAGCSLSAGAELVTGNSPGVYASPYDISDRYLTVGHGSSASLSLNGAHDYFGLYWGSADSYNELSFFLNNVLVASFGGDELGPLMADGNQASYSSNRYVNFFFSGNDRFDRVTLASNGYAFESDNHAFGKSVSVPEPATLGLLGAGLLPLLWRRKRTPAQA